MNDLVGSRSQEELDPFHPCAVCTIRDSEFMDIKLT